MRITSLAAILAGSMLIGCSSKPKADAAAPPEASNAQAPLNGVAPTGAELPPKARVAPPLDPSGGSAAALAQKTSAYAAELEPLLPETDPLTSPSAPLSPQSDRTPLAESRKSESATATTTVAAAALSEESALPTTTPATPAPAITRADQPVANAGVSVSSDADRPDAPRPERDATAAPMAVPAGSHPQLAKYFVKRISEDPLDVVAHLDYQLARYLENASVPDLSAIAPLPAEDREIVTAIMDGLSNFRSNLRADGNLLASRKIAPIIESADRLRAQADLSLGRIELCERVDRYGVYEPFESTRFPLHRADGRMQEFIVYCEVSHFSSRPVIDAKRRSVFETKLTLETAIFADTEGGLQVWGGGAGEEIVDHCRNRRRDFFIAKKITIPASFEPGAYLLKVGVIDQHAGRIAEATRAFQLVGDGSATRGATLRPR